MRPGPSHSRLGLGARVSLSVPCRRTNLRLDFVFTCFRVAAMLPLIFHFLYFLPHDLDFSVGMQAQHLCLCAALLCSIQFISLGGQPVFKGGCAMRSIRTTSVKSFYLVLLIASTFFFTTPIFLVHYKSTHAKRESYSRKVFAAGAEDRASGRA